MFQFGGALLGLVPGRIGQRLRAGYYMQTAAECHADVAIGFLAVIESPEIRLGQGVCVGALAVLGQAEIGEGAVIDNRVTVKSERGPVQIGRNARIGEGAIVAASVGNECTVAAGTVVDKPVPARSTVSGNPFCLQWR